MPLKRSKKQSKKRSKKRVSRKLPKVDKKALPPYLKKKLEHLEKAMSRHSLSSPTRGWSLQSPKKGRERHEMMRKCGKKCFLKPDTEQFPICAYDRLKHKPSCRVCKAGVLSAYVRSRQWKHVGVAKKAKAIMMKK